MELSEVLNNISQYSGVTSDSRQVQPDSIFVAIFGDETDGHKYIDDARKRGAQLVVTQKGGGDLQVPDSRAALADLSAAFYKNPSHGLKVIGITGTSGKTTTSFILESLLTAAGYRVGVIGTVNYRFADQVRAATHTTPESCKVQALLREMADAGCNAVVMEISSHGLYQRRVKNVAFDAVMFTNLTQDHLDYHSDMESYFGAKKILFTDSVSYSLAQNKNVAAIVNGGGEYGSRLVGELKNNSKLKLKPYRVDDFTFKQDLNGFELQYQSQVLRSHLVGTFNVENALAAVMAAESLGVSVSDIQKGLGQLKRIAGRFEKVENDREIQAYVDYAHKPDAVKKVLSMAQTVVPKGSQLITVLGCGGNRDQSKRSVMGKLAVDHSDLFIATSDNPRDEDPDKIIQEMVAEIDQKDRILIEPDRAKAIQLAVSRAKAGDFVLVLGKGHETYQIVGGKRIPFDDREVISQAISGA